MRQDQVLLRDRVNDERCTWRANAGTDIDVARFEAGHGCDRRGAVDAYQAWWPVCACAYRDLLHRGATS
jgi:hypothetical protein